MHLELTEILVCPDCGPGHGLIAFVDRMEQRRIVAGRLDCPMCERRHRIEDGTVRLAPGSRSGSSEAPSAVRGEPPRDAHSGPELPDDAAAVAAALLGPPESSEVLLLAAGTPVLAPALADLRPEATIVTYGAARTVASADAGSHARVYPLVVAGDDAAPGLPLRSGVLDGAVLAGSSAPRFLEGVVRALSTGGRLVVLSPNSAATAALAELEGVERLAADPRAWVGSRL